MLVKRNPPDFMDFLQILCPFDGTMVMSLSELQGNLENEDFFSPAAETCWRLAVFEGIVD